jgi:hypothetical protein
MLLATSCWNITANKKKEVFEMKSKKIPAIVIIVVSLSVSALMALAGQDRFTLKAPNGVAFSEFRGYENWQDVAVSQTEDGIKAILANPVMINAYREGVPGNGKPFPGSMIAKIEWSKKKGPAPPYFVEVPDALEIGFVHREGFQEIPVHEWMGICSVFI